MTHRAWRFVRATAGTVLGRAGYAAPVSHDPVDLRGLDPASALIRAQGLPFVIDVPLAHLRNCDAMGFACGEHAGNPLTDTVRQYLADKTLSYPQSALKIYYDRFQPAHVADTLGLAAGQPPHSRPLHPLLLQPPILYFYPWVIPPLADFELHITRRQRLRARENRFHGARLGHEHGHFAWGPVSPRKGALELDSLKRVTDNIRDKGFLPETGKDAVRISILTHDGQLRYHCRIGNHRVSALAALGYASVSARADPKIIDRAGVADWPGVAQGVFTTGQALAVFDRIFHGNPSA